MFFKRNNLILFVAFVLFILLGNISNVKAACEFGSPDGVRNAAFPEDCDTADFGPATCNTLGFPAGGILNCTGVCAFNTSNCCTIVNNPTVAINPASLSGSPGQAKTYSLSVKNNNTGSCANRTFALSLSGLTACVPGWIDDLEANTGALASQATYTKNVVITSCASSPAGADNFSIAATDGSGSGNDTADYVVTAPLVENCAVVGDEDGDGDADCADSDCLGKAPCCGDGVKQSYEGCDTLGNVNCTGSEICAGCVSCIGSSIAGECPAGYDDCDCNGTCEMAVFSDPLNCGKCGNACAGNYCNNGSCVPVTGGLVPCGRMYDNPNTVWNEQESCKICHVVPLMDSVIEYLLGIVALITVLAIVMGGILYVSSAGDASKVTIAKTAATKSLLGFVFVFVAWVIVNVGMVVFGFNDPLGDGSWAKFDCGLVTAPIDQYCGDGLVHSPNSDGINEACDPKELKIDFIIRKTNFPGNCINGDTVCPIGCFTAIDNDCVNKSDSAAWVETIYSCDSSLCDYGCVGDVTFPGFIDIGGGCYNPLGTDTCQKGRYVCDFNTDTVICQNTYNDSNYRLAGSYCADIFDECCVDGGAALPTMTFDIIRLPTTNITSCGDWDCYWPGYQDGVCTCPAGYSCDDICKQNGGKVCIGVGLMDVSAYHCISLKDNFGSAPCSGDYQCNNSANLLTNDCRAEFYTTLWTCDECSDLSPVDGTDEAYDFSVGETACYCM